MVFLIPLGEFLLNLAMAAGIFTSIFVGPDHLKQFQDYLWGPVPQQRQTAPLPQLSKEAEAMLDDAYQHMTAVFAEYQMLLKLQGPPGL